MKLEDIAKADARTNAGNGRIVQVRVLPLLPFMTTVDAAVKHELTQASGAGVKSDTT